MLYDLTDLQISHCEALTRNITDHIQSAGGWIGFDEFMHLALYAPGLGYYSAGAQKFGEQGDFVTAPLISPLFGICLADQCEQVLQHCDHSRPRVIVEFGAGTGKLASQLLTHLNTLENLPDEYVIVETSPDLRQRQQQCLESEIPELQINVRWTEQFDQGCQYINGIVIANELLDAMPVKKFEIGTDSKVRETGVIQVENSFQWQTTERLLPEAIQHRMEKYSLTPGYQSEVGLQGEGWVRTVGERLDCGAILLVDYGYPASEYYHIDRNGGTIMCHFRHHTHPDPLQIPGLQDITAHVNFSAIEKAAEEVGLECAGYCSQASFLLSLGILDTYHKLFEAVSSNRDSITLANQVKKLTMPQEMGELFKVIGFTRNLDTPLKGFEMHNYRDRL